MMNRGSCFSFRSAIHLVLILHNLHTLELYTKHCILYECLCMTSTLNLEHVMEFYLHGLDLVSNRPPRTSTRHSSRALYQAS